MTRKDNKGRRLKDKEPPTGPLFLDTLAQVDIKQQKGKPSKGNSPKEVFLKRARAKYFTNGIISHLVKVEDSPLIKSYWNTYHCASCLIQAGNKIISKYCNNRWCIVCNRIRTAKLINGYLPVIKEFKQPYFITLTSVTVSQKSIKSEIERKSDIFTNITRTAKTKGYDVKALRKIEITYNSDDDKYHVHLHSICDGRELAEYIKDKWLKHNYGKSVNHAQDIRPINTDDEKSVIELFKYNAKMISKETIHIRALDKIFIAMRKKRSIATYGIKKQVSEDIDELNADEFDLFTNEDIWLWMEKDWISTTTGETLTDYSPSESIVKLLSSCKV